MLSDLGSGLLTASTNSILSEGSYPSPAIAEFGNKSRSGNRKNPKTVRQQVNELPLEKRNNKSRSGNRKNPKTVRQQVNELPLEKRNAFVSLRVRWRGTVGNNPRLPDALLLRYARLYSFDERETWDALRKLQKSHIQRMLTLDVDSLEQQLRSGTLFPLPGMRTKQGDEVFYMKPSRFNPKETPTQQVVDNLAYVMSCMVEKEANAISGIAFLANMNDWTYEHFSQEYCRKFMEMLQGQVLPFRVNLFLIVNPPQWFGKIWRIMKPMLSSDFQKKVRIVPESELFEHLQFNYEKHLPDDMESGKAPCEQLVDDFIQNRRLVEKRRRHRDTSGRQLTESTVGSSDETAQLDITPGCYCGLFKRFGQSRRKRRCTPNPQSSSLNVDDTDL